MDKQIPSTAVEDPTDASPTDATPAVPPLESATTSQSSPDRSKATTGVPKDSIWSRLGRSASIAKKQALLKKLTSLDMPSADVAIGTKAQGVGIGKDYYKHLYESVDRIDAAIAAKRVPIKAEVHATLTDKAKLATVNAKNRAEVEVLLLNRKRLLAELGKHLREEPETDPSLAAEVDAARQVLARVASTEKEIASLSAAVPRLLRRPFFATGVLMVLLWLVYNSGSIKSFYDHWSIERQIARQSQEASAEAARLKLEAERVALQMKLEVAKRERDREVQHAQRELEVKQEEMEREKRDREALLEVAQIQEEREKRDIEEALKFSQEQERREAELRAEEMEREKRDREAAVNEAQEQERREKELLGEQMVMREEMKKKTAEEAAQAKIAHATEQATRARLAADKFRTFLPPKVVLCNSLKQQNATVELSGKLSKPITELLKKSDWLGLINLAVDKQYEELPGVEEMDSALNNLMNTEFKILLRTSLAESNDRRLYVISFSGEGSSVSSYSVFWDKHPDGIGLLHSWRPEDGQVVIVLSNWEQIKFLGKVQDSIRSQEEALKQKCELGEIGENAVQARMAEIRDAAYKKVFNWASNL